MAYSSPSSSKILTVTQEEFKTFHSIDRILFTRFVINLNRDPGESMQVMALLLWLELADEVNDLVDKMVSWPDTLINALADESVLCLNCVERDDFPIPLETHHDIVPLLHSLTKSGVSLRFFHDHRLRIIRGVTKIVADVCVRAFDDILQQAMKNKVVDEKNTLNMLNSYGQVINPMLPVFYPGVGFYGPPNGAPNSHQNLRPNMNGANPAFLAGLDPYDLAYQRQFLNNEVGDVMNHMTINSGEEEKEVPPDNRTIFLTFSKGYHISEGEVRDYFTRKFGDCIETIYMQEVPAEEQPLYARLVVRSASSIDLILERRSKAKFSINMKHVWARKYVPRNLKSPPLPSTPSQPASTPGASQTQTH